MPDRPRRAYLWLLRLYPQDFRRRYQTPMLQLFDDLRNSSLPGYTPPSLTRIYFETLDGAVQEQAAAWRRRITGDPSMPTRPARSNRRRLIIAGVAGGAVVVLGLISYFTNFWGPLGPYETAVQTFTTAQRIANISRSLNFGSEDVAASFVNEYVQSKYYGDTHGTVGYESAYASSTLKQNIAQQYNSMQPDFDPIVCGQQAPQSVKYVHTPHPLGVLGYAAEYADFTYPGSAATNRVQFDLVLDQTKSTNGEWKVVGITCTTLDEVASHPYKLRYEPGDRNTEYDTRNDRTFGSAR